MRRYWIALLVAGACAAAPAPLAAQQPTTVDSTYYAFTAMLEYALVGPYRFPGASIRLSTVRGDLEWPAYSAGASLVGMEWGEVAFNFGVGANMMVDGPLYFGAEAGLLVLGLTRHFILPIPTAHGRLGARLGDVGPVVEVRGGLIWKAPLIGVALGFRF